MKSDDLLKFRDLVINKIRELLSSQYKFIISKTASEVISQAPKFDSPEINELVFVLRRIEKGMFGECIICRHEIPDDILEANLTTRLCPACQMALLEKSEAAK